MKVILKIGHMEILLPNDQGLSTVIRTLSRGVECYESLYRGEVTVGDQVPIEFKTVPAKTKFKPKKDRDTPEEQEVLALPEPRSIQL